MQYRFAVIFGPHGRTWVKYCWRELFIQPVCFHVMDLISYNNTGWNISKKNCCWIKKRKLTKFAWKAYLYVLIISLRIPLIWKTLCIIFLWCVQMATDEIFIMGFTDIWVKASENSLRGTLILISSFFLNVTLL